MTMGILSHHLHPRLMVRLRHRNPDQDPQMYIQDTANWLEDLTKSSPYISADEQLVLSKAAEVLRAEVLLYNPI